MKALNIIVSVIATLGFLTSGILACALLWQAGYVASTFTTAAAHIAALWFIWFRGPV